ncbi:PAAR domain-containing protein [Halopseudomonas aestusnigri]|uniref:Zn-binding Pro-Ala-Ala-Arg (PAAR) domain-containing protein, incolved in TypeVI secretion n=1 Tax=Halopseudomonas aestusnigri TaxID=857252 RepID=A0AAQ1GA53_9GAMM|nr:PAAR domain-containing protein [Halopseudomonas aestusnigri]SEG68446.1 Zn-binding Pro-Ala-Ala-Arg (PAAR) domain-containing protein, incolved in TypeVI secretion [Halopseudomonas aestusnigri]
MSGKPAARLGDPTQCPQTGHGSQRLVSGATDVLFDGKPAARLGDTSSCGSPLSSQLISNVLINGRPAAVLGSVGAHGDRITSGSPTVLIDNQSGSAESRAAQAMIITGLVRTLQALFDVPVQPGASNAVPLEREEEEEEEETELPQKQRITLRVGMFFDGTLNNLPNAALTAQCRREDLAQLGPDGLEAVTRFCESQGYNDSDSDAFFDQRPDNSYGNELSNVALLFRLYRDDSQRQIEPATTQACVKVYVEGAGSKAGEEDATMGMAFGQGETGVVERVEQSPVLLKRMIDNLRYRNPELVIENIEFDIFGFSRGAASARHFANEVLKTDNGILATNLDTQPPAFAPDFSIKDSISINFIGLFDTVAAIGAPTQGHLSVGDDYNPGVNLHLPPRCARKVVHLTAADEHRHNFSLNRVDKAHEELVLPGVHSNLGGGYPTLTYERLLLGSPVFFLSDDYPLDGLARQKLVRSRAWLTRQHEEALFRERGLPGDGRLILHERALRRMPKARILLGLSIERTVRGELSRVSLKVMHAKGLAYGVPFDTINEHDARFTIPADLKPIADKVYAAAMIGISPALSRDEQRFLHSRYIHCSANWNPVKTFMANKPRDGFTRAIYPDKKQKGYPV